MREFAILLTAAVLIAGTSPVRAATRVDGPGGTFSIEVPESWNVTRGATGSGTQLTLHGPGSLDITIAVAHRPLEHSELALEAGRLLDDLIESSRATTNTLGNRVIQIVPVEPLKEPWPAFAVVASNADDTLLMTSIRSVIGARVWTVTTLTDNLQSSREMMATVEAVVGSLEIH